MTNYRLQQAYLHQLYLVIYPLSSRRVGSLARSHLEYADSLWNPYQIQDIKALEKVQMRATRLVIALRYKPYQERLRTLVLPTLKFRRLTGDMIQTCKVLSGIYDTSVSPEIPIISEYATRCNSLKIANRRCHYNLRKYSFSMRITNVRNSLPFSVVTAQFSQLI